MGDIARMLLKCKMRFKGIFKRFNGAFPVA